MVPVTEEQSGSSFGGVMRRRRGIGSAIVGLTMGLLLGFFMLNYRTIARRRLELGNSAITLSSEDDEMAAVGGREEMAAAATVAPGAVTSENSPARRRSEASRALLYVGVMTAERYLGTRAKSVYETWGKDVSGKIEFFSSEVSSLPENCSELPLVALPRVTDVYPPQKKSFLMLQYMWRNYGDRYEWFLRADDDVYVRTDRLEKLLRSVDSRKAMYIGQAGRGSNNERGHLSLEYNENFCMGGPGVVLSRETLGKIVPHIKQCLKNLYTTHEDVEIGRCVQKYAGISCTWSYEMAKIFHHNGSGKGAYTGNLKREEVHRAITLHPVKNPSHMYRIHNYMRGLRIQDLQQEKIRLLRDVRTVTRELEMSFTEFKKRHLANVTLFPKFSDFREFSENYPGDTEILGVPASLTSFKPRTSREVIPWDFYTKLEYSLADLHPRKRIPSNVKESMSDITRQVMAVINSSSRQRGRIVEERSTLYGYRRVNVYGADTILDLLLVYRKYRGRKVTLPVRRHVYLHQHFTGLEIREVVNCDEVGQHERRTNSKDSSLGIFPSGFLSFNAERSGDQVITKSVKFILPLSGRHSIFERFLKNYEEICLLREKQRTKLMIVLYHRTNDESYNRTLDLVDKMRYKYGYDEIDVLVGDGDFSRAKALEMGVAKSNDEDLLFFIDVDIVFTASALNRIRFNTVLNRRIYFPVVFSQFNPRVVYGDNSNAGNFAIDDRSGLWREFGYGIVSIYREDYRKIGGFDLSINGWGKEDVGLYEKALNSKFDIFRSPDVNLIHVYHDVDCDEKLTSTQLTMCRGTRANTYASTEVLARMIHENPEYLRFAKSRVSTPTNPAA